MAHFLLIHGACHGGWCWDDVAARLRAAGHRASAPDLPCDDVTAGLEEYASTAIAALEGDHEEVVVVGHSLGALVVPIVADRVSARRMVLLAGLIGAPNASLASLAEVDADRDLPFGDGALEFDSRGLFRFSAEAARRLLYPDCAEPVARAAIAKLRFQRSLWKEVARFAAWPATEIVAITCTEDLIVRPSWSDRVARERLGVEPVRLPGGHSPFLGRPAELTAVLTQGL